MSILVAVYLLLDDILVEHLIVELKRLLIDQVVVETLADGLDDVTLLVVCVLLTMLGGAHILFPELVLVLEGKILVTDKSLRWGHHELLNSVVVEVVHLSVEDVPVEFASLLIKLFLKLFELVLHSLGLVVPVLIHIFGVAGLFLV